jgi:hypothetical protein
VANHVKTDNGNEAESFGEAMKFAATVVMSYLDDGRSE